MNLFKRIGDQWHELAHASDKWVLTLELIAALVVVFMVAGFALLDSGKTVAFTVVDENGLGVEGARVQVFDIKSQRVTQGKTNVDGLLKLNVRNEILEFRISKTGFDAFVGDLGKKQDYASAVLAHSNPSRSEFPSGSLLNRTPTRANPIPTLQYALPTTIPVQPRVSPETPLPFRTPASTQVTPVMPEPKATSTPSNTPTPSVAPSPTPSIQKIHPSLSAVIVLYDEAYGANPYLSEKKLQQRIKMLADTGIGRVYLTLDVGGKAIYQSGVRETFSGMHFPDSSGIVRTLKQYDPIERAVAYAHEYSMEAYAYFTAFEEAIPRVVYYDAERRNQFGHRPMESTYFQQHPDYYWQSREYAQAVRGCKGITKIVFQARENGTRLEPQNLSIYHRNSTAVPATAYGGPIVRSKSSNEKGDVIVLDGLDIPFGWVNITQPFEDNYTFSNAPLNNLVKFYSGDTLLPFHRFAFSETGKSRQQYQVIPDYGWALDYRNRSLELWVFPGCVSGNVTKIVLQSRETHTRLQPQNISVHYYESLPYSPSTGNEHFKTYDGPVQYSKSTNAQGDVITLDGLNIPAGWINLTQRFSDENYTFSNRRLNQLVTFYSGDIPLRYNRFALSENGKSRQQYDGIPDYGFALDYKNRSLEFEVYPSFVVGAPSYSQPEVADYQLRKIKEVVDRYEFDGIGISIRTHNGDIVASSFLYPRSDEPALNPQYEYNPAIVQRYQNRFGSSPLDGTVDAKLVERMDALRGEFFTDFITQASTVTKNAGKKLVVMTPLLNENGQIPSRETDVAYTYYPKYPYQNWEKQGIVDGLIVFTARGLPTYSQAWDNEFDAYETQVPVDVFYDLAWATNGSRFYNFTRLALAHPNVDGIVFFERLEFTRHPELINATRALAGS